ncbi:hypothetical protein [Deinococcus ruber]|uniref:Proteinase inhibitor I42 chagasin domain-containing protein n=1 Tax=Deinococcus ruber TaxID=1848197 RepID=A0A918C6F3_9DEIO|nr:hypothetical protein [Deinococcus ruber]GGR07343.1 hypothetical protein GCM10008957_20020 [Deinococcus ruber]
MRVYLPTLRSFLPSRVRPALAVLLLSGLAGAGGGVPAPVPAPKPADVTFDEEPSSDATVTVHAGGLLRVHVSEPHIDDLRRWFAMSSGEAGLQLTGRDAQSEGDHGYFSTIFDVTYTYRVASTASGTAALLFAYITPPMLHDDSLQMSPPSLHWLTVKIVK